MLRPTVYKVRSIESRMLRCSNIKQQETLSDSVTYKLEQRLVAKLTIKIHPKSSKTNILFADRLAPVTVKLNRIVRGLAPWK